MRGSHDLRTYPATVTSSAMESRRTAMIEYAVGSSALIESERRDNMKYRYFVCDKGTGLESDILTSNVPLTRI